LIIAPNGKSILIDCGAAGTADSVYKTITDAGGLTSIDYFVCTHYHDDHYRGLKNLLSKGITIAEKYYDRDSTDWLPDSTKDSEAYQYYEKASAGKREYLRPGTKISIDSTVDIECIVANGRARGEYGEIEYPTDENGYSLGLIVSYNGFDFLIMGDLDEDVESKLVRRGVLRDVDVYHVDHHGAETSSYDDLLSVIKPEVCVISSGTNGTYKHPRKATVQRLEALASVKDIFQLNKNLDASRYPNTIANVAEDHIGDLACVGDGGTLLIDVGTDMYTVKLLKRNIEKTYSIER
jgi:beta-lactamase superfamily II metal-dependent hydrolase